mmetsp:Transcript_15548/g.32920  ORF Transcript_15548/g.32920 Transcript_15548/m.32920 type:complete len:237 (-) Transcript_15548:70-780(-)
MCFSGMPCNGWPASSPASSFPAASLASDGCSLGPAWAQKRRGVKRLCEKFLRMGSRSAIVTARGQASVTSAAAASTPASAIWTSMSSCFCLAKFFSSTVRATSALLSTVFSGVSEVKGSEASVVLSSLFHIDLAVTNVPTAAVILRFPGNSSQMGSPLRSSRITINLYSKASPPGSGRAAEDQSGKASAVVAMGTALSAVQDPKSPWPPTTKTASPGRVLLHSTAKTVEAAIGKRS